MPRHDRRGPARTVFGKPDVAMPEGSEDHVRVVETANKRQPSNGTADEVAFLESHPNQVAYPGAVLTEYEDTPGDNQQRNVVEVYETLPGPWIPFTRYDMLLGPVQGKKRRVAYTGQLPTLTATVETTYESRSGSAIVAWETVETSGTGVTGFTAYPIRDEDIYDEVRGAVQRRSQLVVRTGSEAGTFTANGTATLTSYRPYNEFLLDKIIETWVLPGPTITTSDYEKESAVKITVAKTLKLRSAITESYSVSAGDANVAALTTTEIENTGIASTLGIEVVTTTPAAAAYNSETAVVEVKLKPYQFPGRINIEKDAPAQGHYSLDTYGTAIGFRKPTAELVSHVIRTWWVNSETRPSIAFDELNPNTITINDVRYENVLHDATSRVYGVYTVLIAATQPSYSQYMGDGLMDGNGNMVWSGGWVGTRRLIDGSITEIQRYRWEVVTVGVVMK